MSGLGPMLRQCGLDLPHEVLERLLNYLDELLRWNRSVNLTAITDRDEALEKHLCDSLTLLPLLRGDELMLDLGSGGGLPGIPLSIACPELRVVSVDAVEKKILFQRHVARLLGLRHFDARHRRAEQLAAEGARFDVITSRAFASLADFVRLALPVLGHDGRLLVMKGPEGEAELEAERGSLDQLGVRHIETRRIRLPQSGSRRVLIVLQKDVAPNI